MAVVARAVMCGLVLDTAAGPSMLDFQDPEHRIFGNARLRLSDVARALHQTLDALDFIHSLNMIFGDMKVGGWVLCA